MYAYESLTGALISVIRQGPSELFRGFLASSLRDAPYAGLFVLFYEGIKRESCMFLLSSYSYCYFISFPPRLVLIVPSTSQAHAAALHSISAASAGAIATLITHPFDVIKACPFETHALFSSSICRPKFKSVQKTVTTASSGLYQPFGP